MHTARPVGVRGTESRARTRWWCVCGILTVVLKLSPSRLHASRPVCPARTLSGAIPIASSAHAFSVYYGDDPRRINRRKQCVTQSLGRSPTSRVSCVVLVSVTGGVIAIVTQSSLSAAAAGVILARSCCALATALPRVALTRRGEDGVKPAKACRTQAPRSVTFATTLIDGATRLPIAVSRRQINAAIPPSLEQNACVSSEFDWHASG